MKKRKIELNQKLFLNKERIYKMTGTDTQQMLGGGSGLSGDENCIQPVNNGGGGQQVLRSGIAVGLCAQGMSLSPINCYEPGTQVTGNAVCNSLVNKCGNGISVVGNVCAPK